MDSVGSVLASTIYTILSGHSHVRYLDLIHIPGIRIVTLFAFRGAWSLSPELQMLHGQDFSFGAG